MNRSLTIGQRAITDDGDCYVIAEIGHNHQGDVEKARSLLHAAKECGADAVKLQKRDNRALYTRAMYDKPYDNENSFGATYGAHREALELGWEAYVELQRTACELGLDFFATAFDFPSADFLNKLGVSSFKIASGDVKNIPLLTHVAKFQKPVIMSTGGATLDDIRRAYDAMMLINRRFCILQCTAAYPVEAEELNLRVITTLRDAFPDVIVGLSDHFNGISMAIAAYVLGARVVEKHFTLNHTWKGTDHAFSLEPVGFKKMVRDLRRARVALGDGNKRPYASEQSPLVKMGKTLVAGRALPAGHVLAADDIAIKSPAGGLPPYDLDRLVGRRLRKAVELDEAIQLTYLDGTA
jgi:N-acetylneuraminate synthase/sialic acid synthase